ncbi:thiamine-phosphate kinase [Rhabdochromatium marinum]|uniref:thiamine-phosphate kinase n=1 Tax=Rhabdochromatium marinum TaxID=48729 RepID=UPI001904C6E8|nr:thiamine-phosphate kinase [Rhabdochromatium marinum]MBK1650546.1 hypothetical protein [Rhabdochromatium marinum]
MNSRIISELGEREIISKFISPAISPFYNDFKFDDCAVIPCAGNRLLVSTDQGPRKSFLELLGIGSPADIGHFHLTINISDIAAMGGMPVCFVMALALSPSTTTEFLESYITGIRDAADEYKVKLVGGDTKEADVLRNSITVIGNVANDKPLGRHLARPGQEVYITGMCGAVLSNYIDASRARLVGEEIKLSRPRAKVEEGLLLNNSGKCSCCIDMSDGLFFSAEEIAKASGVRIALDLDGLPISFPKSGVANSDAWKNYILNVGGDSDLLFTLDKGDASIAKELGAIKVGDVLPLSHGRAGLHKEPLANFKYIYEPWEHFKSSQRISTDIRSFV